MSLLTREPLGGSGIWLQVTLKDTRKEILLSADTVLVLDRFSPSSPCRRCLESVVDPQPPPQPVGPPSPDAWTSSPRLLLPQLPLPNASLEGSAAAPRRSNPNESASAEDTSDSGHALGAEEASPRASPQLNAVPEPTGTTPFLYLRIEILDKDSPPSQSISLEVSPLHCVLTPTLLTRLYHWARDGWGGARIYTYYLVLWVYRFEHLVTISLRGLEAVTAATLEKKEWSLDQSYREPQFAHRPMTRLPRRAGVTQLADGLLAAAASPL